MCDDYTHNTRVLIPGQTMNLGEFKEKCGNKWDWTLPKDDKYLWKQRSNREKMKNIWNKFGREILQYYLDKNGKEIKYIPYIQLMMFTKLNFQLNTIFALLSMGLVPCVGKLKGLEFLLVS